MIFGAPATISPSHGPAIVARTGAGHFNPAPSTPPAAAAPNTTSAPPAAETPTTVEASMLSTKWLLGLGLAAAAGGAVYFFRKK